MAMNRRDFLHLACAGTCGAAMHRLLSPSNDFMAYAAPFDSAASQAGLPVLLLIFFGGGCSYNMANPTNSLWRAQNPTVSYDPGTGANFGIALPTNEQVLHPQLTAVKTMFDAGDAAIVNMVGYPGPNRAHDESTMIWQTGKTNGYTASSGWGANLACGLGSLFSGFALNGSSALTEGNCQTGGGFTSLNSLQNTQSNFWWESNKGNLLMADVQKNVLLEGGATAAASAQYVQGQMDSYDNVVQSVAGATNFNLGVTFPGTSIGLQLEKAAKLILAPSIPVRVISCGMGGFDTHSNERDAHNNLFSQLNAALAAFHQTMINAGRWNDVIVMTMSEFGRTTSENGSAGTDHGHASVQLVLGGRVNGGVVSPAPTTAQIQAAQAQDYFVDFNVDFRDMISQAIALMGIDPTPMFPTFGKNPNLHLFS